MTRPLISHLGIAVADLAAAIRIYRTLLGVEPASIHEVTDQKVKVAFFANAPDGPAAGGQVELLQATSDDSPIARFIDKRGEGLHHICIYVDDLDARLAELRAAGVRLIDETPRIGAEGHRVAFVHPSGANGVLIELEERR
jgi:methylmalonyl-CoA/ethylmalonyl-CoA epimerase